MRYLSSTVPDRHRSTWLPGPPPPFILTIAAPGSLVPAGALSAALVAACLLAGRLSGALLAAGSRLLRE